MPEEILIITLVGIVSSAVIAVFAIATFRRYLETKNASRANPNSLTRTELADVVTRAVEDAVAPLRAKLDRIEGTSANADKEASLLDDMDTYSSHESYADEIRVRRSSR